MDNGCMRLQCLKVESAEGRKYRADHARILVAIIVVHGFAFDIGLGALGPGARRARWAHGPRARLDIGAPRPWARRAFANLAWLAAARDTRRALGHTRLEHILGHVGQRRALGLEHVLAHVRHGRARWHTRLEHIFGHIRRRWASACGDCHGCDRRRKASTFAAAVSALGTRIRLAPALGRRLLANVALVCTVFIRRLSRWTAQRHEPFNGLESLGSHHQQNGDKDGHKWNGRFPH
jgi:hypothetical protein